MRVLEQAEEFVNSQASVPKQRSERPLRELVVVRNRQAPMGRCRVPKNDVASGLMVDRVAHLLKRLDRGPAGRYREPGHTATSTISSDMDGGTGSPCLARLARYPCMASAALANASTRVLP